MATWSRKHEEKLAAILQSMQREAHPFDDMSPKAVKHRKALPFLDWCVTYLPHWFSSPFAAFHQRAVATMDELGVPQFHCWFRGSGKTTLLSIARSVWQIAERRRHFIIHGGRSEQVAAERTSIILQELRENPRLLADYKKSIQLKRGRAEEGDFVVNRTRVWVRGIGQSPRGATYGHHRPDEFVGDDLEDNIIARNPRSEQKLWDWLMSAVFPALEGAGVESSMIVLSTAYGRHCLMARAKQMHQELDDDGRLLCRYYEHPALDPVSGESVWPERYSTAQLHRAEAIMGTRLFAREMLCRFENEDAAFHPAWFEHFDSSGIDRKALRVVCYVDPSQRASETSDFKAVVVLGRQPGRPEIYCLHAWIKRCTAIQMINELYRIRERYEPAVIACEDNAYALLWELLRQPSVQQGRGQLFIRPITSTANKLDRIVGKAPLLEQRRCYFDPREGDQRLLIDQFLDLGQGAVNDDGADAYCGGIDLLPRDDAVGQVDVIVRDDYGAAFGLPRRVTGEIPGESSPRERVE